MNYSKIIFQLSNLVISRFNASVAVVFLRDGNIRVEHYAEMLRQFHHYAKENPGLQMLAATRFRGDERGLQRRMVNHAVSEMGHDQLALNDLEAMGFDSKHILYQNPLPTTSALIAFPFHQILNRNPVGYLGCILFLEQLPVQSGGYYMKLLANAGIPENAMSFIAEHKNIDIHHVELMGDYLARLVRTDSDFQSVCYCLKSMGVHYANMLWGAIQQVENPIEWGDCQEERSKIAALL